ncbi:MAG: hypothetical protein J6X03_02160 [Bacilli bacterium]|nr:hypothetical protein [Bacilli bacterium]
MKTLIRTLEKAKNISAWKINASETESCELFYVDKRLETNRATDTVDYLVTIYVDKDDKRGTSTFTYYPYMNEKDIKEKIDEAVYASQFTFNKFFDIPAKEALNFENEETNLDKKPFIKIIKDVQKAIFKADKFKDGYLSATEIFLYKIKSTIVNSKGVNLSFTKYKGNIETIPSWKKKDDEVELYNMISFSSFDPEDITKQIKEVLLLAKARSKAKQLKPKKLVNNVSIIIQDEEVEEIFDSLAYDLNYAAKYQHVNHFDVGQNIQGENIDGSALNLKLVPTFKNAMNSSPVDEDGVILKELSLIEDGVVKNIFGSYKFGYYLGVERPTGNIPVIVVKEGTKTFEEMKKSPYIRCVRFSGIQFDLDSGFIGGEVRLGFYFDGVKEVPVTGFSISGDFNEVKSKMEFSKETTTRTGYHGPKYIELKGMNIV